MSAPRRPAAILLLVLGCAWPSAEVWQAGQSPGQPMHAAEGRLGSPGAPLRATGGAAQRPRARQRALQVLRPPRPCLPASLPLPRQEPDHAQLAGGTFCRQPPARALAPALTAAAAPRPGLHEPRNLQRPPCCSLPRTARCPTLLSTAATLCCSLGTKVSGASLPVRLLPLHRADPPWPCPVQPCTACGASLRVTALPSGCPSRPIWLRLCRPPIVSADGQRLAASRRQVAEGRCPGCIRCRPGPSHPPARRPNHSRQLDVRLQHDHYGRQLVRLLFAGGAARMRCPSCRSVPHPLPALYCPAGIPALWTATASLGCA